MGREHGRHSRPTSELDRKEIARLAAETREDLDLGEDSFAGIIEDEVFEMSVLARAPTLHDPLTTSLLAEIARQSQTVELEPEIEVEDESDDKHWPQGTGTTHQPAPRRR